MSRKPRIFPTAVFIACEGQSTEPNYFERIKEEIEEDGLLAITIYPDNRDRDSKTHPIGLITECQKRLKEGFDEVWAVYDKNGYEKHQEAIDLANTVIEGKTVNIAFSSISFEVWILLHFEKNIPAFLKSDCKDDKEKYLNCGTNTNNGDCEGTKCVGGYLRSKGYFPAYSKKKNLDSYKLLKPKTTEAIINSAWIEKNLVANTEIFNQNPLSTVSFLVKRLLHISTHFYWGVLNEKHEIKYISLLLSINDNNINVSVVNLKERMMVLQEMTIFLVMENGVNQKIKIPTGILLIEEKKEISFQLIAGAKFIRIEIEDTHTFFEI